MHYTIVLLSYSVFCVLALGLWLIAEAIYTGHFRLLGYSWQAYLMMLLTAVTNNFGLTCQTIASQNERPGFVTLITYVGLVYAFCGDIVLFGLTYSWMECACIAVIFGLNVGVVTYNLKSKD